MNLAVKRKWAEIYYSFEEKQNVCEPTKFGHDLFKTFEYWIDKKAQKRVARKKQINGVMSGFQKVLQGMPKVIQQISSMMASFSPPKKTKSKSKRRKKNKKNDDYNELYDDLLKGWS
jgi:hypothetical protein